MIQHIGVVGWGWWGATKWRGKHTLCIYTCIMDPLVPELAQKVVKSVDNITTRSCETLQLGGLCLTASRDSWIQTEGSDTKWNLVHFAWNLKWNLESYLGIWNLVLRINPNKSY